MLPRPSITTITWRTALTTQVDWEVFLDRTIENSRRFGLVAGQLVPDAGQFYISGQVNRPGNFPVLPNLTIRQALVLAGGVTATGSANKVGLIRGTAKEVDADPSQIIQKNDVIIVKERLF